MIVLEKAVFEEEAKPTPETPWQESVLMQCVRQEKMRFSFQKEHISQFSPAMTSFSKIPVFDPLNL